MLPAVHWCPVAEKDGMKLICGHEDEIRITMKIQSLCLIMVSTKIQRVNISTETKYNIENAGSFTVGMIFSATQTDSGTEPDGGQHHFAEHHHLSGCSVQYFL